jgi:hypothetical protein
MVNGTRRLKTVRTRETVYVITRLHANRHPNRPSRSSAVSLAEGGTGFQVASHADRWHVGSRVFRQQIIRRFSAGGLMQPGLPSAE